MKEKQREYDKQRYWLSPDEHRERSRVYKKQNPERYKLVRKSWWDKNPGARNAARMTYHARKIQAVPAWADLEEIKKIYEQAKQLTMSTSEEYHVDHIIPLQSSKVCGLHVACNLRVIPADANRRKQNFITGELTWQ